MSRLAAKSAIITGAGSGIGRASAVLFAREGARLLIMDRDGAGLAGTLDAVRAHQPDSVAVVGDAGAEPDVKAAVEEASGRFGRLDVVFANAGISGGLLPFGSHTPELFADILRVNLIGPYLAIKHAAPIMTRAGRGAIVLTASVAGLRAGAADIPYSASKAGVISLAQTCAAALIGTGVRVNALCPGLIETGMTRFLFDRAAERGTSHRIGQFTPAQRAGRPEDVAALALFLASDESDYVNGQAFPVDGGLTATHPFLPPKR